MGAILNEIEDVLMHYGMPRRSGRYPWGSGENPYQHSGDFLSRVYELRKQNFTYTDERCVETVYDHALHICTLLSTFPWTRIICVLFNRSFR